MDYNQKRLASADFKKVKLPYKMFSGMQKKSVERFKDQRDMDKKSGIVADSSRNAPKKIMQSFFEKKQGEKEEMKKWNLDKERGLNLHLHSGAKFKDGALNLTKQGINEIEGRTEHNHKKRSHNRPQTFDEI